jgi:hypothetical protein
MKSIHFEVTQRGHFSICRSEVIRYIGSKNSDIFPFDSIADFSTSFDGEEYLKADKTICGQTINESTYMLT